MRCLSLRTVNYFHFSPSPINPSNLHNREHLFLRRSICLSSLTIVITRSHCNDVLRIRFPLHTLSIYRSQSYIGLYFIQGNCALFIWYSNTVLYLCIYTENWIVCMQKMHCLETIDDFFSVECYFICEIRRNRNELSVWRWFCFQLENSQPT